MQEKDKANLPDSFQDAAEAPKPEQRAVTLLVDVDVIDWLQGEAKNWQGHVNELLRFYKDTSRQREELFAGLWAEPDEPEDYAAPAPAPAP